MKSKSPHVVLCVTVLVTAACSAEIGSETWCEEMREKPKEEWLAEEIKPYFSSCIAGQPIEEGDE